MSDEKSVEKPTEEQPEERQIPELRFEAGLSSRDHRAFIRVSWGEMSGVMTPHEARAHALGVLEAAEAAETDEFLIEFFTNTVRVDFDKAVPLLREFRQHREKRLTEARESFNK